VAAGVGWLNGFAATDSRQQLATWRVFGELFQRINVLTENALRGWHNYLAN
jgi:hypothetical protein